MLFLNKETLEETDTLIKYRVLYQGLKPEYYYWEFYNTVRKLGLITIVVFLSAYPDVFRAFLAILILAFMIKYQEKIKPYKDPRHTTLEFREMLTSVSSSRPPCSCSPSSAACSSSSTRCPAACASSSSS